MMTGQAKRTSGETPKGAFSEWERLVDTGVGKAAWKAAVGGDLPQVKYKVASGQRKPVKGKLSPEIFVVDVPKAGKAAGIGRKGMVLRGTTPMSARSPDARPVMIVLKEAKAECERARKERQVRVLYYYQLADKAFGDHKLARKFMTRKHPKFGVSPLEKLATEWGGREVEQVLNSMIYGLPA